MPFTPVGAGRAIAMARLQGETCGGLVADATGKVAIQTPAGIAFVDPSAVPTQGDARSDKMKSAVDDWFDQHGS